MASLNYWFGVDPDLIDALGISTLRVFLPSGESTPVFSIATDQTFTIGNSVVAVRGMTDGKRVVVVGSDKSSVYYFVNSETGQRTMPSAAYAVVATPAAPDPVPDPGTGGGSGTGTGTGTGTTTDTTNPVLFTLGGVEFHQRDLISGAVGMGIGLVLK